MYTYITGITKYHLIIVFTIGLEKKRYSVIKTCGVSLKIINDTCI